MKQKIIQSPLRYPGGKRRLASYIAEVLRARTLRPALFVEPFAGGASVSIAMLENDLVDEIALSDLDELVASFWSVVFSSQAEELAARCINTEITLEAWTRINLSSPINSFDRAFKCLFLNRTSFSGILNRRAGPLGGWTQAKRTLDCRFPRYRLAERIRELSKLKGRVQFIRAQTWKTTAAQVRQTRLARDNPGAIFWYLDPPFFNKANRLYRYFFELAGHRALARTVTDLPGHWLVSYDAAPEVRELYSAQNMHHLNMVYTARKQDRAIAGREILVSDLALPGLTAAATQSRRIKLAVLDGLPPNTALADHHVVSTSPPEKARA